MWRWLTRDPGQDLKSPSVLVRVARGGKANLEESPSGGPLRVALAGVCPKAPGAGGWVCRSKAAGSGRAASLRASSMRRARTSFLKPTWQEAGAPARQNPQKEARRRARRRVDRHIRQPYDTAATMSPSLAAAFLTCESRGTHRHTWISTPVIVHPFPKGATSTIRGNKQSEQGGIVHGHAMLGRSGLE